LFLITFITAIPAALILYLPVLDDPRYIVGAGGVDMSVSLGALLEVILCIANIGTAVVLFPVLKRQNEILALGYVALVSLNRPSSWSAEDESGSADCDRRRRGDWTEVQLEDVENWPGSWAGPTSKIGASPSTPSRRSPRRRKRRARTGGSRTDGAPPGSWCFHPVASGAV
jgi:hypothetical protein